MRRGTFVSSRDGTALSLARVGAGESVVLVHGTAGGKGDWLEVARRLASDYSVTSYDRRGRGSSGDGVEYSLDREIDDLVTVIEACATPVHLVGHSFGAILCLLAAARGEAHVSDLVVYEPPLGVSNVVDDRWLDEADASIAAGDLDTAVRRFAAIANIAEDELAAIEHAEPAWNSMCAACRVATREIRALREALPLHQDALSRIETPTLVLLGTDTTHPTYAGVSDLAQQLRAATLETVPGRHVAIAFAPDAFAAKLRSFLAERAT